MPSDSTVFVDTNVLLYAQDPRDEFKRGRAMAWLGECWRRQTGRISHQVLHELYANLSRTAPELSLLERREIVRRYRSWNPWGVDADTVDDAWLIQDRFKLSYWDSLVVASAHALGCRWLLTEDLQHGQVLEGLTVISPFESLPERVWP